MASPDSKLQQPMTSVPSLSTATDAYRVKSIATRLTEAELSEIESAASKTGEKVSEWLRDISSASFAAHKRSERTRSFGGDHGHEVPHSESVCQGIARATEHGRPAQDVCLCGLGKDDRAVTRSKRCCR